MSVSSEFIPLGNGKIAANLSKRNVLESKQKIVSYIFNYVSVKYETRMLEEFASY